MKKRKDDIKTSLKGEVKFILLLQYIDIVNSSVPVA
jgi:hypothetical protein